MAIQITPEQRQQLIDRTIKSLGYNPSASGYSASEIQAHLYQAIAGLDVSDTDINLVSLINDIATTLNGSIASINSKIPSGTTELASKQYVDTQDATKVNTSTYTAKIGNIETTISQKASISALNELARKVNSIETSGDLSQYAKKTEIPTKTSDLTNDSNFVSDISGKQDKLTFDNTPTANSTNPVTSGGVYTSIQSIQENMQGKKATYVINCFSGTESANINSQFNTNDLFSVATSSTKTLYVSSEDGYESIALSSLKLGDTILIEQTDVPDRWVSFFNNEIVFNKLETQKIDLTSYATTSSVSSAIANTHTHSNKSLLDQMTGVITATTGTGKGNKLNINVTGELEIGDHQIYTGGGGTFELNNIHTHSNKATLDSISGIDELPTANSDNLVKSGGVYSYVATNGGKIDDIKLNGSSILDTTTKTATIPTTTANTMALQEVDTIGIDTTATSGSANLITSGGVYTAISSKGDKFGTSFSTETASITLADNTSIRLTNDITGTLSISNPSLMANDFVCELVFKAGTGISLTYAVVWQFSGDDCSNKVFTPKADKTYNVLFFNNALSDGTPNYQAIVRGI